MLCGQYSYCVISARTVRSVLVLCGQYSCCAVRSVLVLCGQYSYCAISARTVRSVLVLCGQYSYCAVSARTVQSVLVLCGQCSYCAVSNPSAWLPHVRCFFTLNPMTLRIFSVAGPTKYNLDNMTGKTVQSNKICAPSITIGRRFQGRKLQPRWRFALRSC